MRQSMGGNSAAIVAVGLVVLAAACAAAVLLAWVVMRDDDGGGEGGGSAAAATGDVGATSDVSSGGAPPPAPDGGAAPIGGASLVDAGTVPPAAGPAATVPAPPSGGVWKKARNTFYNSYPAPGSNECKNYNGCAWAGQFAYGGKKSEEWVKANNIVAFFDKSAGNAGALKGKQIRLRKNGKEFIASVLDTCGDSDCSGCCSKNAAQTGYLVDLEKHTCIRELGSAAACTGLIEWQEVVGGGAGAGTSSARRASRSRLSRKSRSKRSRPRSRARSPSRSSGRSRSRRARGVRRRR